MVGGNGRAIRTVDAVSSVTHEHLSIVHPDEGRRYKLNVSTPVGRLTIGKVKECLAAASSCPIPLEEMVLHLNGVPLYDDNTLCANLGIASGTTLSVEAGGASVGRGVAHRTTAASPALPSELPMSRQRRLLELHTLQQQDEMLHSGVAVQDALLRNTLRHVDEKMDRAQLHRRQLERQRARAEEELVRTQEREADAARERESLAALQAQEAARSVARAVELAERKEQLRAEQEAARAVARLALENERKKALLAEKRRFFEAERERARLEQEKFEKATTTRALDIRARELDLEHQRLACSREASALDRDRRRATQQRLHYYAQLGLEAPLELQREAARLLFTADEENVVAEESDVNAGDDEKHWRAQASCEGHTPLPRQSGRTAVGQSVEEDTETLEQRHGTPALPVADHAKRRGETGRGGGVPSRPSPLSTSSSSAPRLVATIPDGEFLDARENARANLRCLGDDLGLHDALQFDESDTCIIGIDGEYTLLVTFDAATDRLYMYATLLASLPPILHDSATCRLRFYEFLLEASLLGRDMCGGGVGISTRRSFVLLSTSLHMPTSQSCALRTLTPPFLHCLRYWRERLAEFLQTLEERPPSRGAPPTSSMPTRNPDESGADQEYPRSPPPAPTTAEVDPSESSVVPSRAVPVLGLEVTGTVLVNGIVTHYDGGVLVVNTAGPSALAGVQPNDFIEEVDGVRIRTVNDFRRVVATQLEPGMRVPVRLKRGGVAMVVTVRVEAARP